MTHIRTTKGPLRQAIVFQYMKHFIVLTIYIDCGNLTAPTDGEVSMPSGTTINKFAIYECDVGHQIAGHYVRICLGNSSWSDSAPTCNKIGKRVTRISSGNIQG